MLANEGNAREIKIFQTLWSPLPGLHQEWPDNILTMLVMRNVLLIFSAY